MTHPLAGAAHVEFYTEIGEQLPVKSKGLTTVTASSYDGTTLTAPELRCPLYKVELSIAVNCQAAWRLRLGDALQVKIDTVTDINCTSVLATMMIESTAVHQSGIIVEGRLLWSDFPPVYNGSSDYAPSTKDLLTLLQG